MSGLGATAGLEDRANLAFASAEHAEEARRPFDGLGQGLRLEHRIGGDEFLRLDEGTVDHGDLAIRDADAGALRTGLQARGIDEDAGFSNFLHELAHSLEEFRARRLP